MGVVYLAEQDSLRPVALKLLRLDAGLAAAGGALSAEAELLGQ
jgi:hypothetical protein